jgi:hypothetical protein
MFPPVMHSNCRLNYILPPTTRTLQYDFQKKITLLVNTKVTVAQVLLITVSNTSY